MNTVEGFTAFQLPLYSASYRMRSHMQESHSAHPYEVPHRIDDPVFDNLCHRKSHGQHKPHCLVLSGKR